MQNGLALLLVNTGKCGYYELSATRNSKNINIFAESEFRGTNPLTFRLRPNRIYCAFMFRNQIEYISRRCSFPFQIMLLHLCVALLGGQTVGISANCVTENPAYPYFNGTSCVSCDAGTKGALPFFYQDKNECVSECPTEAPNPGTDNVCRRCPANKPMWSGFECIDCLDAYPLGDLPFFDPTFRMCLPSCPFGAPANSDNICLPCANANGDTQSLWDPESRTCVFECKGIS